MEQRDSGYLVVSLSPWAVGHSADSKPCADDGTRLWANQMQSGRMRIST
jgi:hypothetical protein